MPCENGLKRPVFRAVDTEIPQYPIASQAILSDETSLDTS
jgi:hypothetical protein